MKEFYGAVSFTGRISFCVEADDKKTATDIVFEDIEGIEIKLKDGTTLSVSEIEWELIKESRRGNVQQPYIDDFYIVEEKS